MNIRVADIGACYDQWRARGATFLTAPIDHGGEIRCYMRDPDGHLIEVGQVVPAPWERVTVASEDLRGPGDRRPGRLPRPAASFPG